MSPVEQFPAARLKIRVRGAVQGVGFRPFVYRLATRHALSGFVLNDSEGVLLEVEGQRLHPFVAALREEPPPLARIDDMDLTAIPPTGSARFEIRASIAGRARTRLIADAATCDACLSELFDPASRFYYYPFVTCTHCGPRFTITRHMPYDRAQTSMAGFPLCWDCARDYADPKGRRFHAETIACPRCGPSLSQPVETIAATLREGRIVALKGIGGFHLLCDAGNEAAVSRLRARKQRGDKPFAVMVANAASADLVATPTAAERTLAESKERPIVLMRRRNCLAPSVAPGLAHVGIMLPYAPVHHLLFHALAGEPPADAPWQGRALPVALVATSANPGGEPLVIENDDVRLGRLADLVVSHDRPIVARADDSVMAVVAGAPAYIRRARGAVPEPIDLGQDGPVVVGLGGTLKTTVTVTRGREAFVSQHIGDLDTAAAIRFHRESLTHLLAILDVTPEAVGCDGHPDFHTTRMAVASGLPVFPAQHHVAHIAAVAAEHRLQGPLLGLALDGHGHGADGGAWGGELLRIEGADWQRLGHLAPLALPGGDRAAREPWRMGLAALDTLGRAHEAAALFPDMPAAQLARTLEGAGRTTSMGRLFDAVAGLLGLCSRQNYEGQAAMALEALVHRPRSLAGGYQVRDHVLDFRPLLGAMLDCRDDPQTGAELFHGTVIEGLLAWIGIAVAEHGRLPVALGGGCLINRVLAEGLAAGLKARGIMPLMARQVPPNDGGLSLGQASLVRHWLMAGAKSAKEEPCVSPSLCA